MKTSEITPGRDYGYTSYPRKGYSPQSYRGSLTRVRVLKTGQERTLKGERNWGQKSARKDGIEIRYYRKDENGNDVLSDRTAVVTARNLIAGWADYQIESQRAQAEQEARRRKAERERREVIAQNTVLSERIKALGIEDAYAAPPEYSPERRWQLERDTLAKLLALIPVQQANAEEAAQAAYNALADEEAA